MKVLLFILGYLAGVVIWMVVLALSGAKAGRILGVVLIAVFWPIAAPVACIFMATTYFLDKFRGRDRD